MARPAETLAQEVVAVKELAAAVARLARQHGVEKLALGDRTAAKQVLGRLREAKISLEVVLVDEHRSTEEARRRYFRENPPRGWRLSRALNRRAGWRAPINGVRCSRTCIAAADTTTRPGAIATSR